MNNNKQLSEKEWVEKYLNNSTYGWQELFSSGMVNTDALEQGYLKRLISKYANASSNLYIQLKELGYEGGKLYI